MESDSAVQQMPGNEKGLKPLPISLKIVLVFVALNVVFTSLVIGRAPYTVLTYTFEGMPALIASGVLNILGAVVLVIAFLNHYKWGGKFAFAYIGFFLLNSILSVLTVILSQQDGKCDSYILVPLVLGAMVNGALLFAVFKEKRYFELQGNK